MKKVLLKYHSSIFRVMYLLTTTYALASYRESQVGYPQIGVSVAIGVFSFLALVYYFIDRDEHGKRDINKLYMIAFMLLIPFIMLFGYFYPVLGNAIMWSLVFLIIISSIVKRVKEKGR